MDLDLNSLLEKYRGTTSVEPAQQAEEDFGNVAQAAPPEVVKSGLSEAFRSDQTPPFAEMVGQLFGQGNAHQQAGMLNQLLGSLAPAALSALAGSGVLGGGLGGLLGRLGGAQAPSVSPEQATQMSQDEVQEIAKHAEQHNPGIVDRMSGFYAEHPDLVKTIGGAALTIALAKIAERMKS